MYGEREEGERVRFVYLTLAVVLSGYAILFAYMGMFGWAVLDVGLALWNAYNAGAGKS